LNQLHVTQGLSLYPFELAHFKQSSFVRKQGSPKSKLSTLHGVFELQGCAQILAGSSLAQLIAIINERVVKRIIFFICIQCSV
ncbi:MAG: hypothetical protein RJB42_1255, partial [Bacteroidota bacterium]